MSLWQGDPVFAASRRFILSNHEKFVAVLRSWDEDGDGCINVKEFRDACRVLLLDCRFGKKIPREVLDELFSDLDSQSSGNIPMDDLAVALQLMPVPDEPKLEAVREEGSSMSAHERRFRRRSKSLPSSPTGSPVPVRPPAMFPSLSPSPSPERNGSSSVGASPIGIRSSSVQPPSRMNLPRLSNASITGSAASLSHRSRASCCSSAASSSLSPQERVERRMQRERELRAAQERRKTQDDGTPGVGKYDISAGTIGARASAARSKCSSSWAIDTSVQHPTLDNHGRSVDLRHKTHVGDPGKYSSHTHEMAAVQNRSGNAALTFCSATPQRPA